MSALFTLLRSCFSGHTNGFLERERDDAAFSPRRAKVVLRTFMGRSAREILDARDHNLRRCAPPTDDVTLVVIELGR